MLIYSINATTLSKNSNCQCIIISQNILSERTWEITVKVQQQNSNHSKVDSCTISKMSHLNGPCQTHEIRQIDCDVWSQFGSEPILAICATYRFVLKHKRFTIHTKNTTKCRKVCVLVRPLTY